MYNPKQLRTELYRILSGACTIGSKSFPVCFGERKTDSSVYVIFNIEDLISYDGKNSIDLEINIIGPESDEETLENISLRVIRELDGGIVYTDEFAFYTYRSTRNRIEGSDPHTVRFRINFDLFLYERN